MSDAVNDEAEAGPVPEQTAAPKKKKKLIVIAAAALLVLGGGGGATAWLMGGGEGHAAEGAPAEKEAGAYIEVPPMTVNLRSGDGKPRYLKLRFILVAGDPANEDKVNEKLPLILDGMQPFLRELRPEDLSGSAAVFRLKEEMLTRATRVAGPGIVTDVLIQDLIQQ